ncbi:MAG: methyltransferase domain-containing protein [Acidobacteriota bacterium]
MSAYGDNAAQIREWSGEKGRAWIQFQGSLDQMMAPFLPVLGSAIGPPGGRRVLDVGCGCGALGLDLAARGASVTGLDVSFPMLVQARRRAAAAGLEARWVTADASLLEPRRGRFDRVVSRFGVMFFAHPVAAFRQLRRMLAAGGELVFACWRGAQENSWVQAPTDIARALIEVPPPPEGYQPGPFSLADRRFLRRTLAAAGFSRVAIAPADVALGAVGETAEAITDFYAHTGPMSKFLESADRAQRTALHRTLAAWVRDEVIPGRFRARGAAWIVSAS